MVRGVHNYSEIGKLNKVLLHRIGSEVDGLVPDNFARLLFDDIPYLKVAQQEHDRFADILRENGVEVVYYADEVAKAIEKPDIKDRFIREMLDEVNFSSRGVKEAIYAYLIAMTPRKHVLHTRSGCLRRKRSHHTPHEHGHKKAREPAVQIHI